MEAPIPPKYVYRFSLFQVDPERGELLRQGVPVKLQEQPFRVLCLLLERPGELVTREELQQSLWPQGTHVEFDGSLNATLKRLRFGLGDDADNPVFIETVPRRGYRFIAPVQRAQPEEVNSLSAGTLKQPGLKTDDGGSSAWVDTRNSAKTENSWRRMWSWVALAVFAVVLAMLGWRSSHKNRAVQAAAPKVIAVLPLSNEGAGADLDYLRYAIANDLVTDLAYAPSVTVRPFASTSRYGSEPVDPETVGKELRVTHVVTGGFVVDDKSLRVNLELFDVALNQEVWREEILASPRDLVALHESAARATKGLLGAMKVSNVFEGEVSAPKNEQAIELFLHSMSIPLDPEPNLIAIRNLEDSVALDGSYAPAWGELSRRYGIDYRYGKGGEAAAAKSLEAYRRQSELDPNWPSVPTSLRAEQGDLNGAYDQAAEFLRRHPNLAFAHHSMSYVLRSAGLLDEANKECDAALALDAGFNGFRSCAMPYILQGDYTRAQSYIRLDEKSGFGAMLRMMIALRTGDSATALSESEAASQGGFRFADVAHLYLSHSGEVELHRAVAELEADPRSQHDPEMHYFTAAVLSFCGQRDVAIEQLQESIRGNYCSYPDLDNDPLFNPIRKRPEFSELRRAAIQCQEAFVAHRRQVDVTAASH